MTLPAATRLHCFPLPPSLQHLYRDTRNKRLRVCLLPRTALLAVLTELRTPYMLAAWTRLYTVTVLRISTYRTLLYTEF